MNALMKTIGKGKAEMPVSAIGYGAMGLTAFYNEMVPEAEAVKILRKAYDLGVRHFDTAQVYQRQEGGKTFYNEDVVGKFLSTLTKEQRKDVTVGTKYYPAPDIKVFDVEKFNEGVKISAKRLGVQSIDLFYFHRIIPSSVAPVEKWMRAAKKLVEQGLIKRIGLSEASPQVIREANAIYPITCVQQEWSLFAQDLEREVVPVCKELGIGIISYSPVGRGFLAGTFGKDDKPSDWRQTIPYLAQQNLEKNLKIREEIKAIADAKGCSLSQICLAWVVAKGGVPIPGSTSEKHIADNMGALKVELTDAEIQKLGELGSKVTGARGDESYMKRTYHNNL